MHPDEAVDIALQDLRSLTRIEATRVRHAPAPVSPLATVWRRYVDGWKWYAAADFAPPAAEPAYPLRRHRAARPAARTAAAPCVHRPLELLFGRPAVAAGCR
jgi:hypothetical protein